MKVNTKASELEEYKERLNFVTEWLQHPIIELDSSMKIIYLNKSAEFQFPDIKTLGINHLVLAGIEEMAGELFQGDSEIIILEREVKIKNLIYEQQIFSSPKNKLLYLFMTDTTKRKEAELARQKVEAQLYQSQKMEAIGELSGGIAHDFNNILMIVQGNLQLLQTMADLGAENKRVLAALEATRRGTELSKRLLAFARRENLQPQIIVLEKFMQELMKLLAPALGAGIELDMSLAPNVGKIMVDPNQLENALMNMAINGSHAMEGQGKIHFAVANFDVTEDTKSSMEPGPYVKISISDNGHGIAPENLSRVFEPFFTTKEAGKGTGLGLSMVYGFVVQSRGYIQIESKVNSGTTFNLYFRRLDSVEPPTEEKTEVNAAPAEMNVASKIILIVDDEKDVLDLLCSYLRKIGYIVLHANNGEAALTILKNTLKVDLVLSDIAMPGKYTGFDLANEVERLYPKTKILLTSGHLTQSTSEQAKYKILTKPYNLNDLALQLKQSLGVE